MELVVGSFGYFLVGIVLLIFCFALSYSLRIEVASKGLSSFWVLIALFISLVVAVYFFIREV
ncbi:MAG: hypothetical protein ACXAEU_23845 [Candidatus Hodarchaeales archaeon]|jgi:hypothetical protein